MQDDDEIDGLNPTSMWRRTRRKDPFKYEDEEEEEQKKEEEDDEDEEDHKHITNTGKLHPFYTSCCSEGGAASEEP
jgi:hypothetical protein